MIPEITMDQAGKLASECEYAALATNTDENPINWGDAGMFFHEGYNHAMDVLYKMEAATRFTAIPFGQKKKEMK